MASGRWRRRRRSHPVWESDGVPIGRGWIHPNARRKRIDQARQLSARHRAAA